MNTKPPPVPDNEFYRLQALLEYDILDTEQEAVFDELTQLAATVCNTSMAFLSFMDKDRQWFKSVIGFVLREAPRDSSFCAHAIADHHLLEIADVRQDERFKDHPMVKDAPHIRFYASMPIIDAQGYALGTLCVFDSQVQTLSEHQRRVFKQLAKAVLAQLEAHRSQRQQQAQQRLHLAALNAGSDGFVIADATQSSLPIIYISPAFSELTGYSEAECLGRNCRFLQGPETDQDTVAAMGKALQEQRPFTAEILNYRKSGEPFWNQVHIDAVRDDKGDVSHFVGTQTDITQRKKLEFSLIESNTDLQQYAYAIGHDLQSPLRAVNIHLETIRDEFQEQLDPELNTFLDSALNGVQRMNALLQGLLAYARLESRAKPPVTVDTQEIIDQVQQDLQPAIQETHAQISYGTLPKVSMEPSQCYQLFLNLINNALKYRSEQVPVIRIEAKQVRQRHVFSIADNGIGIPAKHQEKVFQIFKQLHSPSKYSGIGLGLALCARIVSRHSGAIWVESERGQGATFYFTIPVAAEDE